MGIDTIIMTMAIMQKMNTNLLNWLGWTNENLLNRVYIKSYYLTHTHSFAA